MREKGAGERDSHEKLVGAGSLELFQPINQVTDKGIRRPSSQKSRNSGFAEDTSSLKQLNKEKKGKKKTLHKARPKLMLFALHLHIYT